MAIIKADIEMILLYNFPFFYLTHEHLWLIYENKNVIAVFFYVMEEIEITNMQIFKSCAWKEVWSLT